MTTRYMVIPVSAGFKVWDSMGALPPVCLPFKTEADALAAYLNAAHGELTLEGMSRPLTTIVTVRADRLQQDDIVRLPTICYGLPPHPERADRWALQSFDHQPWRYVYEVDVTGARFETEYDGPGADPWSETGEGFVRLRVAHDNPNEANYPYRTVALHEHALVEVQVDVQEGKEG